MPLGVLFSGITSWLVNHYIIRSSWVEDVYHIAMATVHDMDFLLARNFRHIAATMQGQIDRASRTHGFARPLIITPEQLPGEITIRKDPIIQEIHKIRDKHAAQFNDDPVAIYHHLKRLKKESGREIVTFEPKRVLEIHGVEENQNAHDIASHPRYLLKRLTKKILSGENKVVFLFGSAL
uniref:Uncharacterized protein n=1 Tax=Candidatus Kentrum sp. MB TaxID=2138164 RepID=A0A450XW39_9GAMM|nr:MAG: hypothetical protein BECKMB1821G_GA0114241_104810 [Candidatus Kentron sp. MB]VFK33509.1 MAG: hypothetical protein BECKMB1821I_GA0114274_104710 [Candidatus Kentron sp. MB]VFK76244.1 MAG: hypothetical protein BECKMB1821H_GA0114242_10489 [Candidatus Kentron sp. MB]